MTLIGACAAAGVLMYLGDATSQLIERILGQKGGDTEDQDDEETALVRKPPPEGEGMDCVRSGRLGLIGFFWRGPTQYGWYMLITTIYPVHTLTDAVVATVIDQLAWTPWCDAMFLMVESFSRTFSPSAAWGEMVEKIWPVLAANWATWPWVNLAMYYYIPLEWMVPFNALMNYIWNIFLTFVAARPARLP
eukprot:Sspe_Gene.110419::Locus_91239_Transcript_1_1_Confidence_1.000_Length_656::g.110419::m.110419/K13348/MPV17; protein Mpv17